MRNRLFMKSSGLLARVAALGLVLGLLAGCVAPYAYVQPNTPGSGGYYTSSEPYTGTGYYDYYGTGPYYPGTSGWGYYNGSFPYGGGFGYFGGYGAWPVFFNIGFSSVWDFPGYWGPWYTTTLPLGWYCHHRCDRRRRSHHDHDAWRTTPRPWLHRDRPIVSPLARASRIDRPGADLEVSRALRAAAFAHDHFVRAPAGRILQPRFRNTPLRRMDDSQAFPGIRPRTVRMQQASVMPRGFHPVPRASYAPARAVRLRPSMRVAAPRARHGSGIKIR